MAVERHWQAMGTSVDLSLYGDARLALYATKRIDELEKKWSRFLPYSEITKLNSGTGTPTQVSWETALLIERGIEGFQITSGRFDPTIIGDLIRLGYSSSFDSIENQPSNIDDKFSKGMPEIIISTGNLVTIPEGIGFDPGGIGKGLAADLVSSELMSLGADGVSLSVGGDIRIQGDQDDYTSWSVDIEDIDGSPISTIAIEKGGIATSTTKKRRWMNNESEVNHLIDPSTGQNPKTDVETACVVAAQAWQAEVLTKTLIIGDKEFGQELIEKLGAQYLIINSLGAVSQSSNWSSLVNESCQS